MRDGTSAASVPQARSAFYAAYAKQMRLQTKQERRQAMDLAESSAGAYARAHAEQGDEVLPGLTGESDADELRAFDEVLLEGLDEWVDEEQVSCQRIRGDI